MEEQRWHRIVKGLAISAGYCAAFLVLWRVSFNQWYLPAGLRLACLLLLPIRYWPYVFAGDAAALLMMRAPKADQYSIQWAYLSPFLLISLIAIVPWIFRAYFKGREIIVKKLPAIGLATAIWPSAVGMGLNYFLDGPRKLVTLENFISYSVGNYLGIMMALLPCLLWQQRHQWREKFTDIFQSIRDRCFDDFGTLRSSIHNGSTGNTDPADAFSIYVVTSGLSHCSSRLAWRSSWRHDG